MFVGQVGVEETDSSRYEIPGRTTGRRVRQGPVWVSLCLTGLGKLTDVNLILHGVSRSCIIQVVL